MLRDFFTFSRFTLLVALLISAIAAYYSVLGLTAIFAGAVVPIIIMGTILEIAKITTTVWLHRYWSYAGIAIKTYLTVAVIVLACLTSMGIFGLLSKAHLEQGVIGGGVLDKVALYDEKIKTQRENVDAARKALKQLDDQVNARLERGNTESGAERSVQIRRAQAAERNRLLKDIASAQIEISKLTDERAPYAAQLRKVEAEVGPIKYIAALIYGDNPDQTTLEKSVRWVIILLVAVFDPLAIILILAANYSLVWEKTVKASKEVDNTGEDDVDPPGVEQEDKMDTVDDQQEELLEPDIRVDTTTQDAQNSAIDEQWEQEQVITTNVEPSYRQDNYAISPILYRGHQDFWLQDYGYEIIKHDSDVVDSPDYSPPISAAVDPSIKTDGVTNEAVIFSTDDEYVIWDGKKISTQALKELKPSLVVDGPIQNQILFGTKFPPVAKSGDIYTRVDVVPHKTFKFNGTRWINIDRNESTTYLQNIAYVQYLISKLDSGEYDPELLTGVEQEEISDYLKKSG